MWLIRQSHPNPRRVDVLMVLLCLVSVEYSNSLPLSAVYISSNNKTGFISVAIPETPPEAKYGVDCGLWNRPSYKAIVRRLNHVSVQLEVNCP